MPKFQTRSIEIEAVQWQGNLEELISRDIIFGLLPSGAIRVAGIPQPVEDGQWLLLNAEGTVKGALSPENFERVYEPVMASPEEEDDDIEKFLDELEEEEDDDDEDSSSKGSDAESSGL